MLICSPNNPAANKGRQLTHVLTANGHLELKRRRWHSSIAGSSALGDALSNGHGEPVTMGVIKMAARLNNTSTSFDCGADNLARTAQVSMSGEQLRKLINTVETAVLEALRTGAIPAAFQASDWPADPIGRSGPTRI